MEEGNRKYKRNLPTKRDSGRETIRTMKERKSCDWRLLFGIEEGTKGFKTAWVHFLEDGIEVLKRW